MEGKKMKERSTTLVIEDDPLGDAEAYSTFTKADLLEVIRGHEDALTRTRTQHNREVEELRRQRENLEKVLMSNRELHANLECFLDSLGVPSQPSLHLRISLALLKISGQPVKGR